MMAADCDEKIYDEIDYNKKDVKAIFVLYNYLKDTDLISAHYLWDIPVRTEKSELVPYRDFELSS